MKHAILIVTSFALLASVSVRAEVHDIAVPLQDGKLRLSSLADSVCRKIDLPPVFPADGEVDLNSWRGSLLISSLNAACGEGCHVTVGADALVIHLDSQNLPHDLDATKSAVRTFVATDSPRATAAQASLYGLFLPDHLNSDRPLLVLIHGLDTGIGMLQPMGQSLTEHGYQVAYFGYPSDQAISQDIRLLTRQMVQLHEHYPALRIDLIAHSMGGLVARGYVEGDFYQGNVDRLMMVGTPNHGSSMARYHLLLKAQEQYWQWRTNPQWHWTWMITEGLGEGARDLMPHSKFLAQLNSRSRCPGVAYTIVAGSHSTVATVESKLLASMSKIGGDSARQTWGVGAAEAGLSREADRLAHQTGTGDGAVSIASTKLAGVHDFVIVPADHCALFMGTATTPPAVLPVILDRLSNH